MVKKVTKNSDGVYVIQGKKYAMNIGSRASFGTGSKLWTSEEGPHQNKNGRIVSKKKHTTKKKRDLKKRGTLPKRVNLVMLRRMVLVKRKPAKIKKTNLKTI